MNPLFRPGCRGLRITMMMIFVGGLCCAAEVSNPSQTTKLLGVGATFETLSVGDAITYRQVKVRSVNARTLMISHATGLASVRLEDLTPELQMAFRYDPSAAAAADATLKSAQSASEEKRRNDSASKLVASKKSAPATSSFERLLQSLGQPPQIQATVDLRPQFQSLALNVKNQGARPSCAVFAIISALEFQNAQLTGRAEKFSEEYLIWATCKTLRRPFLSQSDAALNQQAEAGNFDDLDAGFALSEVVTALRAYGIPSQASLPYKFSGRMGGRDDPPPEVIEEARNHRRVSVVSLPGRDQPTRLANLVHALGAGMPVAVGMRWPSSPGIRTGYLNSQQPMDNAGHAVTIVGYQNKTGAIEDTIFTFKNSWGVRWGSGGYGFATYDYLLRNLGETALLDIQPPPNSGPASK